MSTTVLDELSRRPPHLWLSARALDRGAERVTRGEVTRPTVTDSCAAAIVRDRRAGKVRAELRLGPEGLTPRCRCRARAGDCEHVAALALLLTGGAMRAEGDGEPAEPAELERQRRAERARSGLFEVVPEGSKVYGGYEVRSPSGRSYRVVLRALDEAHSGCTCQDFATNLLGTCKHIEATLAFLASERPRRLEAARRAGPPASYLHLGFEPTMEVRLRRVGAEPQVARFARRWFAGARLARPIGDDWGVLLTEAERAGVEVPAEVERLAERSLATAARARRHAEIEAEVRGAGVEQPGLRGRLYPYQVEGVAFLASRGRALLADDMGLGKTAQAIAAMVRMLRKGEIARALVVCPASLKHQWARELDRFVGLPGFQATVIDGSRPARMALYASAGDVVVTSYELLRADEKEVARLAPDLLVLDEAQRIRNWRTRTADVVKRVPTRYAFVLTGTPLENRLDDLYSLMQVVDPHLLGPLWRFNLDFTHLDERGRVKGYRNLSELRARLRPAFLRRRKEEVLSELPERIVSRLGVTLDEEQRDAHDEASATVARLLAILKRRPLSPIEEQRLMRAFQRMRMACDAASLVGGQAQSAPKLDELERLLDEICLQGGHKVVIFSEWEKMQALAAAVAERLGVGHVRLHGGVPTGKRGELIDRFMTDPACQIFFSTDAGGVGLNLQAADHVINLDLPWNPAVLAQRIARVHRLGQKRAVNVVLLCAEDSIESRMEATLAAKRGLFEAAVGDSDLDSIERTTLASRIATLLDETFAAPTGPVPVAPVADPVAALRAQLGDSLRQVLRTRDGRLVGLLADGVEAPPAGQPDQPLLLPSPAAAALAVFGDASPLAGAEILFASAAPAPSSDQTRRRGCLAAAERKLAACRALADAGLTAEALGLARECLVLACRAAAERDPGEDPAALLAAVYGELIPAGALLAADAHALARAGELARAFALSPLPPPAPLVADLGTEAAALLGRLRERLGATVAVPVASVGQPIAQA